MEFTFDMGDMLHVLNVDFGDGRGKVPAHQHIKGGGWVAETAFVDSDCYVGQHAVVYGNARVSGNAIINDHAKVYGDARVYGYAKVYGNSEIYDSAQVFDNSKVSGNSQVFGSAKVADNAMIHDNAEISGNAIVRNNAEIFNNAEISGNGDIYDSIKVYDNCLVTRKPKACFGFDYNVIISDHHITMGCVSFPPSMIETTGKRIIRLMRYTPEDTEKWVQALRFMADFHGCTDRQKDVDSFDERQVLMDLLSGKVGIR
jgi:carbonic anhydrase/acetyltransferase-like protein (isoleucine patch superfamily)